MWKWLMVACLAIGLGGCPGNAPAPEGTVTPAQVAAQVKSTCHFLVSADQISSVAVAIAAQLNQAVGVGAGIFATLAHAVVTGVCSQVNAQVASTTTASSAKGEKKGMTVVVQGVHVTGTYEAP
jgi:hypothetical protein